MYSPSSAQTSVDEDALRTQGARLAAECASCHAATAGADSAAGLAGQPQVEVEFKLTDLRRRPDVAGASRHAVEDLSDDEIRALATYYSTVGGAPATAVASAARKAPPPAAPSVARQENALIFQSPPPSRPAPQAAEAAAAAAFAAAIADVASAQAEPVEEDPAARAAREARIAHNREAQEHLLRLGVDIGVADGVWGARSQAGLTEFLLRKGLSGGGELTDLALDALRAEPTLAGAVIAPEIAAELGVGGADADRLSGGARPDAAARAGLPEPAPAPTADAVGPGVVAVEVVPYQAPAAAEAAPGAPRASLGEVQGEWTGRCVRGDDVNVSEFTLTVTGANYEAEMTFVSPSSGRSLAFLSDGVIDDTGLFSGPFRCRGAANHCRDEITSGDFSGRFPRFEFGDIAGCNVIR